MNWPCGCAPYIVRWGWRYCKRVHHKSYPLEFCAENAGNYSVTYCSAEKYKKKMVNTDPNECEKKRQRSPSVNEYWLGFEKSSIRLDSFGTPFESYLRWIDSDMIIVQLVRSFNGESRLLSKFIWIFFNKSQHRRGILQNEPLFQSLFAIVLQWMNRWIGLLNESH